MWQSVRHTNTSSSLRNMPILQSQISSLECENKEHLSIGYNSEQQLRSKVEITYNLLFMLKNNNLIQTSYKKGSILLAMCKSPDACAAIRQIGKYHNLIVSFSSYA